MLMRASRITVISLTAALALGLAACSGNPTPQASAGSEAGASQEASAEASAAQSTEAVATEAAKSGEETVAVNGVKKDLNTWALPQDAYTRFDLLLQQKGTEVALRKCVAEKGVAVDIPAVPYDAGLSAQIMDEFKAFGRFTPEYAKAKGYRPPLTTEAIRPFMEFTTNIFKTDDVNVVINVGECYGTIYSQYPFLSPLPPLEGESGEGQEAGASPIDTSQLAADATQVVKAMKTPEVQAAIGKWTACMAPAELPDLPDAPFKMPPASKMKEWYADPLVNPFTASAGEAEKQLAHTDAVCRDLSGYNRALYDAMWDHYAKDIEANKATYEQRLKDTKQREEQIQAFISENQ